MKKSAKVLLCLSILFLIIFLAVLFNINNLQLIDDSINSFFSSLNSNFLISMSKAIAWLFEPVIVIIYALIISLMLFIKKFKKDSVIFSVSMLAGGVFMYTIKEIIQRARPENMLVSETGSSFPSGHALISLIFFSFFIYFTLKNIKSRKIKITISIISMLLILIVGLSRLVLNVHFFSDVLGGWLLGLFIILASVSIKQY